MTPREKCWRDYSTDTNAYNDAEAPGFPTFNLNSAMKRLVLGEQWSDRRLKAVRFVLIALPGRVPRHARRLIIRLARGHPSYALLLRARRRILALAAEPYPA